MELYPTAVYGRLSDLCKIPNRKHNLAVSLLLGRHMDSVVVGTRTQATTCVQYLRDNRIEPMEFIPLDTVHVRPCPSLTISNVWMREFGICVLTHFIHVAWCLNSMDPHLWIHSRSDIFFWCNHKLNSASLHGRIRLVTSTDPPISWSMRSSHVHHIAPHCWQILSPTMAFMVFGIFAFDWTVLNCCMIGCSSQHPQGWWNLWYFR